MCLALLIHNGRSTSARKMRISYANVESEAVVTSSNYHCVKIGRFRDASALHEE